MGCVPPLPGFLEALREITARHGALLIFDEVMTGFRVAFGGAQQLYGIQPDLTTLGKVIGGGLPVGAYGGRTRHHEQGRARRSRSIRPARSPAIRWRSPPDSPCCATSRRIPNLRRARTPRRRNSAPTAPPGVTVNRVGSMFTFFFTGPAGHRLGIGQRSDTARFGRFFRAMLDRGIYLAPSQFEAAFLSAAHTDDDIQRTIDAARDAFETC